MIATETEDGPEPAGVSLRDCLRAWQQKGYSGIPVPELIGYVASVADDLDDSERPHGNVRPDTIHIIAGRARLSDPAKATAGMGQYRWAGSPAYMAPEAWGGKAGAEADQYALACAYAELRTGRPPFRGADVAAVMKSHLQAEPDLASCPDAERRVLARALARLQTSGSPPAVAWLMS